MAPTITSVIAAGLQDIAQRLDSSLKVRGQGRSKSRRSGRHLNSGSRTQPSQHSSLGRDNQPSRGFSWSVAEADRQALRFDQGDIATMLDVTDRLYNDSPAAAVAAMHFVEQHREQSFAYSKLTMLMMKVYPHAAAIQNDREAMRMRSNDGQLTTKLAHFETEYLRYAYGVKQFQRRELLALATDLIDIADAFAQREDASHRRQCRARFIAADILLVTGDNEDRANLQMSKALVLAGIAYANQYIIEAAQKANHDSDIIKQTLFDPSSIKLAHELVSQS